MDLVFYFHKNVSAMAKKKNLSENSSQGPLDASDLKFGIVWSRWNEEITRSMQEGCVRTLKNHGAKDENIVSVEVPGAFELPSGARLLASSQAFDAIICIGCVIKGETRHNDYISSAVANALTQFSTMTGLPAIFGVLTPNTWEQAIERAGGKHGNKGDEAAVTAIQMARLKKSLYQTKGKIGFNL